MPVVSTPVKKRPFHVESPASTRAYMRAGERRGGRAGESTELGSFDFESEATMGQGADVNAVDDWIPKQLGDERFGFVSANASVDNFFGDIVGAENAFRRIEFGRKLVKVRITHVSLATDEDGTDFAIRVISSERTIAQQNQFFAGRSELKRKPAGIPLRAGGDSK